MQQRKYSSFKQEAIHYAISHPDKIRKQVAQELGVAYGTFKQRFSGVDLSTINPVSTEPKPPNRSGSTNSNSSLSDKVYPSSH